MKIIFEQDDQKCIESLRKSKESGTDHPLAFVDDGEEHCISFKVIDSVKANAFLFEFMRTDDTGRKMIEDAIGIRVKSKSKSNEDSESKLDQLRELLKEFEVKAKEIFG